MLDPSEKDNKGLPLAARAVSMLPLSHDLELRIVYWRSDQAMDMILLDGWISDV